MSHKRWIYALLLVFTLFVYGDENTPISKSESIWDVIVVEDSNNWLIPTMMPVIAHRQPDNIPPVVLYSETLYEQAYDILSKSKLDRCLVLSKEKYPVNNFGRHLRVHTDPMFTTMQMALRFWKQSKEVVVVTKKDKAAIIQGSILATQMKAPFIVVPKRVTSSKHKKLKWLLDKLKVERIIIPTTFTKKAPKWIKYKNRKRQVIGLLETQRRIIKRLKKSKIKNIILANLLGNIDIDGMAMPPDTSIYIAPYLSLYRKAPVFLVSTYSTVEIEEYVFDFIAKHKISPRSLTILASYKSIGVKTIEIPSKEGFHQEDYFVDVEPCSVPPANNAVSLAIGRIPNNSLEEASFLIARGVIKERSLERQSGKVLMVANPPSTYSPLPLAEVIARITAKEFKNRKIPVREFYNRDFTPSEINHAAKRVNMVIYQGHSYDQKIFPVEEFIEDTYENENKNGGPQQWDWSSDTETVREPTEDPFQTDPQLSGFPVVILQSCNSLDDLLGQRIFNAGGSAIVGSVTSIHSASGSSFIKAFCDSLLYRKATVGEALRDARNYYLCLRDLKQKRGHKQMAKGYRVALSFRLWGDPELRIFSKSLGKVKRHSVSMKFLEPDKIEIITPKRRFPRLENIKYFTRMFPNSEVAGIVKSLKHKDIRRVMLLYFNRIRIPKTFGIEKYKILTRPGDDTVRTTFLVDKEKRYLYVLYFPKKPDKDEKIVLQFK